MNTTARAVSDIAGVIREIDGDNTLTARVLGEAIDTFLRSQGLVVDQANQYAVEDFVARKNLNKMLTSDRLAELIVAEFDLDKEG